MMRTHYPKVLLALLALAICTGTLQAAVTIGASVTTGTTAAFTLKCDTLLGPTPVQVGVKLLSGTTSTVVNLSSSQSYVVLSSPTVTTNSSTNYTYFTVSAAPGCKGIPTTGSVANATITLAPGGIAANGVVVTAAVADATASASALQPQASSVTITCNPNTSSAPRVADNVYSTAYAGTPFTLGALPSWLAATTTGGASIPLAGLTAGNPTPAALNFAVANAATCSGLPTGTTNTTVHLVNPPATDVVINVAALVGGASTLTVPTTPIQMTYTKGPSHTSYTASQNPYSLAVSSGSNVFFSLDTATFPIWANVVVGGAGTSGNTPATINFYPTAGAETLAPGSYGANIGVKVSGQLETYIPVVMQISNPAAALSIAEGLSQSKNWVIGTALPTFVITPISSDSPIQFAVAVNGTGNQLQPATNPASSGVAYSFGSPIAISFQQSVFAAFVPGTTYTSKIDVTPSGGTMQEVTLSVVVLPPVATLLAISPSAVPTMSSGTVSITLTGSGFTGSTVAGIVKNGAMVPDQNVLATYANPTTIILAITVPSSPDPLLPFSSANTIYLGVCNPTSGSVCSAPTGTTQMLTIGVNPIVQAVTSASSYYQAVAPLLTPVAPYDMISIFGKNFCMSSLTTGAAATGCTTTMYGFPQGSALVYPLSLTPDAGATSPRNMTVTFWTHGGSSPTLIGTAPLLFATNNQINALVPSAVTAAATGLPNGYLGQPVDVVVTFGTLASAPYTVLIAANNPGMFTMTGDGQGDAAALINTDGSLITSTNGASVSGLTGSDTIQLYVTGLGAPDSDGVATEAYTGNTVTCMSAQTTTSPAATGYYAAVNSAVNLLTGLNPALTSDDGLVMQPYAFVTNQLQPCLKVASAPTVTIGGQQATVTFAGWVQGAVAGLYQVNASLPLAPLGVLYNNASGAPVTLTATPQAVPVYITMPNTNHSQSAGVSVYLKQVLSMPGGAPGIPGYMAVTGTHGTPIADSTFCVTPTDATGSAIVYSVLYSGSFPSGLGFDASGDGCITGTPASAGTATIYIKAADGGTGSSGLSGTARVDFNIQ